ncbi:hypothetical protein PGT21_026998 [Puccinia graminis f. sp. tritici]|uniref:Uncharacterized protein n=1 Tax=Puccinia graminis f. sp. tritici TaxID=56615 RepID=A0A5B0QX77_PUCGR|nr:hypothetical protein PGT21_026998 [Puccinia graminis f. sp. tritici]
MTIDSECLSWIELQSVNRNRIGRTPLDGRSLPSGLDRYQTDQTARQPDSEEPHPVAVCTDQAKSGWTTRFTAIASPLSIEGTHQSKETQKHQAPKNNQP